MDETSLTLRADDGMALAARLFRPGPPRRLAVLLHGAASNLTRWTEFANATALRQGWDILRPDLRGHGGSLCHGPLTLEIWRRDLVSMLDQITDQPALLIGHSLGAQIATFCAHREPQRLAGAVLIDPVFNQALTGTSRRLYRMRHLLQVLVLLLRMINAAGLRRRRYPSRDLQALDNEVRELLARGEFREFVRRYSSPWPNLRHVPIAVYLQDILATLQPQPPFAAIRVPMLAILARSPTFADPAVAQQIVSTNPGASLSAIDAYHWPLTERPEATRNTIDQWCLERFG